MFEPLKELVVSGIGEIITATVVVIVGLIKRKLEKRKLRRKGLLFDDIGKEIKEMEALK